MIFFHFRKKSNSLYSILWVEFKIESITFSMHDYKELSLTFPGARTGCNIWAWQVPYSIFNILTKDLSFVIFELHPNQILSSSSCSCSSIFQHFDSQSLELESESNVNLKTVVVSVVLLLFLVLSSISVYTLYDSWDDNNLE